MSQTASASSSHQDKRYLDEVGRSSKDHKNKHWVISEVDSSRVIKISHAVNEDDENTEGMEYYCYLSYLNFNFFDDEIIFLRFDRITM